MIRVLRSNLKGCSIKIRLLDRPGQSSHGKNFVSFAHSFLISSSLLPCRIRRLTERLWPISSRTASHSLPTLVCALTTEAKATFRVSPLRLGLKQPASFTKPNLVGEPFSTLRKDRKWVLENIVRSVTISLYRGFAVANQSQLTILAVHASSQCSRFESR